MTSLQLIHADWPAPANIRAVSTTRLSNMDLSNSLGSSDGDYASFNLGAHVGDTQSAVDANRAALQHGLGLQAAPFWLNQTHSCDILNLDELSFEQLNKGGDSNPIDADAAITTMANKACVIMTADCLPVLITNQNGTQVAAVHAGWRGLADGIIEKTIESFDSDPNQLMAWCGPCIGPSAFEVGLEVQDALGGPELAYLPHADASKVYVDLHKLAAHRLNAIGVSDCYFSNHCTFSEPERFFSYRRDGQTGRMASLIWIES